MTKHEIVRVLRLIMAQMVGHRTITMSGIAAQAGLSRVAVYNASHGRMSTDIQYVLSPILRELDVNALIANAHA